MNINGIGGSYNRYPLQKGSQFTQEQIAKLQSELKKELNLKELDVNSQEFKQMATLAGQHKVMLDENDRENFKNYIAAVKKRVQDGEINIKRP